VEVSNVLSEPGVSDVTRDEILTTREAADFLKVSTLTLRRRIQDDSLPAHRMGRKWIFIKSELLEWLRRQ